MERFLERISESTYFDNFIIKGGFLMLSDELIPAVTTNYFIGLVRRNYKLRPERQAPTFETTLYRRLV